jgi:hypothetical protein
MFPHKGMHRSSNHTSKGMNGLHFLWYSHILALGLQEIQVTYFLAWYQSSRFSPTTCATRARLITISDLIHLLHATGTQLAHPCWATTKDSLSLQLVMCPWYTALKDHVPELHQLGVAHPSSQAAGAAWPSGHHAASQLLADFAIHWSIFHHNHGPIWLWSPPKEQLKLVFISEIGLVHWANT